MVGYRAGSISALRLAITVGLTTTIVAPAWGNRVQDYGSAQFLQVLRGLGYPVGATIADPRSQQAIRDFQLQQGLPVDGVASGVTQDRAATIVQGLQAKLNQVLKLNPPLPVSQFYGSQTEQAIQQFQAQNKLPETGIATLETRQKLEYAITIGKVAIPQKTAQEENRGNSPTSNVLQSSDRYSESEIRSMLIGLGNDINPNQPLSDPPARRAIEAFQKHYGLPVDGIAGAETQALMGSIVGILQYNLRLVLKTELLTNERYDEATIAAVKQFQQQHQLRPTGIATLSLRKRINEAAKRLRGQQ